VINDNLVSKFIEFIEKEDRVNAVSLLSYKITALNPILFADENITQEYNYLPDFENDEFLKYTPEKYTKVRKAYLRFTTKLSIKEDVQYFVESTDLSQVINK
jgi:hypothetical protein